MSRWAGGGVGLKTAQQGPAEPRRGAAGQGGVAVARASGREGAAVAGRGEVLHRWNDGARRGGRRPAQQDVAPSQRTQQAVWARHLELAAHDRVAQLVDRGAGERTHAVEGLVQGDAEAELVGASVRRVAVELFGRHVQRGADQRAGAGAAEVVRAAVERRFTLEGAREAEVEDAGAAVVADEDVVGLDVAMDDAGRVRGGQAGAGLLEHGEDLSPAARPGGEPLAERAPADQLHRDVHGVADGADLVDLDDVGMRDAGEGLGLAQQAGLAGRGPLAAKSGQNDLDRQLALELLVVGGVDDAHGALTELAQDDEAPDPRELLHSLAI
jgi:hypothetical protein